MDLTDLTLPSSLVVISDYAFYYVTSLWTLIVPT
jgi:hypothetical protein